MRIILLIASVIVITGKTSAQSQTEKNQQKKEAILKAEETVTAPATTVSATTNKSEGANLTPEEQGYTKKTINGKEVYVKESGQMIFYYQPKK